MIKNETTRKGDNMKQVYLTLKDTKTSNLIERAIDISNVMVPCDECNMIADVETQSKLIKEWIADRGNEQHATALSLVSWYIA